MSLDEKQCSRCHGRMTQVEILTYPGLTQYRCVDCGWLGGSQIHHSAAFRHPDMEKVFGVKFVVDDTLPGENG